jgi:hypothetical protein
VSTGAGAVTWHGRRAITRRLWLHLRLRICAGDSEQEPAEKHASYLSNAHSALEFAFDRCTCSPAGENPYSCMGTVTGELISS